MRGPLGRGLTGRHVAIIFAAGFGLVIAVNLLLAVLAARTFTGTVVQNGFVASQNFNKWLEAGRAQASLGWTPDLRVEAGELVLTVKGAGDVAVTGLSARLRITHPMIADETRDIALAEGPAGLYRGRHDLGAGIWDARIALKDGMGRQFHATERIVVAP
ncbi:FixH family protein [Thermaurantiacus sp.]